MSAIPCSSHENQMAEDRSRKIGLINWACICRPSIAPAIRRLASGPLTAREMPSMQKVHCAQSNPFRKFQVVSYLDKSPNSQLAQASQNSSLIVWMPSRTVIGSRCGRKEGFGRFQELCSRSFGKSRVHRATKQRGPCRQFFHVLHSCLGEESAEFFEANRVWSPWIWLGRKRSLIAV